MITSAPSTVFHSGDFVRERDSEICGHISGPGKHLGEWRVVRADGTDVLCLGEHLYLATAEPGAGDASQAAERE